MAKMNTWQGKLADFAVVLTAGMLLATGGMMMSVGHQQVKITTQIENIIEKLNLLTELRERLGDQKIDVIINNYTKEKDIYKIAKNTRILL